jgi:hypothetical protein
MQTCQSAETLQDRGPSPPPHNGEGTRVSLCVCAKDLLEFQPHILQSAVGQTGADLGQVPPASAPQPLPHPAQSVAVQKDAVYTHSWETSAPGCSGKARSVEVVQSQLGEDDNHVYTWLPKHLLIPSPSSRSAVPI